MCLSSRNHGYGAPKCSKLIKDYIHKKILALKFEHGCIVKGKELSLPVILRFPWFGFIFFSAIFDCLDTDNNPFRRQFYTVRDCEYNAFWLWTDETIATKLAPQRLSLSSLCICDTKLCFKCTQFYGKPPQFSNNFLNSTLTQKPLEKFRDIKGYKLGQGRHKSQKKPQQKSLLTSAHIFFSVSRLNQGFFPFLPLLEKSQCLILNSYYHRLI